MCFSAQVSFGTAALTGVTGIAALSRATRATEVPFAAMPLLFAVQQAVEGARWLALSQAGSAAISSALANVFMTIAIVLWPS